jgi:pyrimidine operon attenuation protein/uracil phosphoribosyltransferase
LSTHVPDRAAEQSSAGKPLLDAGAMSRTLSRIAHEILEKDVAADLVLVGIYTRGVPLARRLRGLIAERSRVECPVGSLDITFHRDDAQIRSGRAPQPVVYGTEIPVALEGRTVVLVDDVLFTGRTVRAAIDALLEFGRPERVQLAVLVDRGHRELPIRPDFVGKNLPTAHDERIQVELAEVDGQDRVLLVRPGNDA